MATKNNAVVPRVWGGPQPQTDQQYILALKSTFVVAFTSHINYALMCCYHENHAPLVVLDCNGKPVDPSRVMESHGKLIE